MNNNNDKNDGIEKKWKAIHKFLVASGYGKFKNNTFYLTRPITIQTVKDIMHAGIPIKIGDLWYF